MPNTFAIPALRLARLAAAASALAGAALVSSAPLHADAQGALRGLYLQSQSMGRGDVWIYYYFWPDGHACRVMPKGGMDPAPAYATVAQQAPNYCGTYALRGNQLTLQFGGTAASTETISNVDATGFALSMFPTIRILAFPAGTRLSGRWGKLFINGSDYRDQTFTFNADGTFAFDDRPVRARGAPAVHIAGTYAIGGNTLVLSANGASQRMSIHGFPAAGDRRLGIDGDVLQPK